MNALRQIISLFVLTAVTGGMSAAVVVSDTIISRGDTLRVPFAGAVAERSIEVRGATGGNTRGATWSVTLADSTGSERLRATLSFGNINDDPFFKPYLRLSVDTIVPGDVWHEVSSAEFTGHVDLYGGANSLTFRQHDGLVSVGAGGDRLMPGVTVPYGYDITSATVAGSRRLKIEYVAVSSRPDRRRALMTGWTPDSLDAYLAQSHDPMEGYWKYLDRDMDARWARLGGFYRLACVRNADGGYDLLYIDGAENRRGLWEPMMRKGRLVTTRFDRHYDLEWVTSRLDDAGPECSADFSDDQILTLNLPLHHAVIRFTRE